MCVCVCVCTHAASPLTRHTTRIARAFVVGSAGLAEELREAGVEPIGGPSFEALAPVRVVTCARVCACAFVDVC